jgi:glycosyltransferase involved in cell wall biosynthesis
MKQLRIAYLTNAAPHSGVGLRAAQLLQQLRQQPDLELVPLPLEVNKLKSWPGILATKTVGWIRAGRKLRPQLAGYDVIDLTNQTLSFLSGSAPSVVTVHDLIERLEPQSGLGGLAAQYLLRGIARAQHIIAVSHYTAETIKEHYDVPDERISVIYNGVDSEFHPIDAFKETIAYQTWKHRLRLPDNARIILSVGSDHPRKNLVTAMQAFAAVHTHRPNTVFIKVGEPGIPAGRVALLDAIAQHKLRDHVRILGQVSQSELNELYNLADVLIFPSRFEGFGLPPLQAMAAGTPVIASHATSLPEVVGNDAEFGPLAALCLDPDDAPGFAQSIERVLNDEALANDLRQKGLERAKRFSWADAATQVAQVYKKLA